MINHNKHIVGNSSYFLDANGPNHVTELGLFLVTILGHGYGLKDSLKPVTHTLFQKLWDESK